MKYKNLKWLFIAVIIIITAAAFAGCKKGNDPAVTDNINAVGSDTTDKKTEEKSPVTEPETMQEPITELPKDTTILETQRTVPVKPAANNDAGTKADRLTSDYINMLTGLPATKAEYYKRPVAIMINNIRISCPQIGISQADVIYECLVEGGMTRLMMLVTNYENCTEIGSVRSSREYYLDFAANHDAIYVHAGGSDTAYSEIYSRKINNLDGVHMYLPDTFYRDAWRMKNMGFEHSLMTTGPKITSAIKYKGYRTDIKDTFDSSFNFVDYNGAKNAMTGGADARHVIITYNNSYFPQFIYDAGTDTYKRYQFNGIAHIDGANNVQLTFTNVLILNLSHLYTGDSYGHVDVDTVGSGNGYYIYGGKYIQIIWTKASKDTAMVLTGTDGTEFKMNCGKTFVNIVSDSVWDTLTLNYKKP